MHFAHETTRFVSASQHEYGIIDPRGPVSRPSRKEHRRRMNRLAFGWEIHQHFKYHDSSDK